MTKQKLILAMHLLRYRTRFVLHDLTRYRENLGKNCNGSQTSRTYFDLKEDQARQMRHTEFIVSTQKKNKRKLSKLTNTNTQTHNYINGLITVD